MNKLDKPSLKKTIISSLAVSKNVPELKDNSLILVTGYGLIVGDIANIEDQENLNPKDYIATLVGEISKQYNNDYYPETNKPLPDSDGYITLENVKLLNTNGRTVNLQHLTVFFDQIIGVTIGNIDY